ncbi:methyltransferase family protein [Chloroflexota bacterium]
MINKLKWLLAIPLILSFALGLPWLTTGDLLWFLASWSDALFVLLVLATGATAVAFVDSERGNRHPGLSRLLISLGLILVIPVTVWERTYGPGVGRGVAWSLIGLVVCLSAAPLGISARHALGKNYVPDPEILPGQILVTHGPYRYVRHPLYSTALLWGTGLALLMRSPWGLAVIALFLVPAVIVRIREEEPILQEAFGEEYCGYVAQSWRLIPYIY